MEYYVDHRDDQFYIITNADEKNYRVSICMAQHLSFQSFCDKKSYKLLFVKSGSCRGYLVSAQVTQVIHC